MKIAFLHEHPNWSDSLLEAFARKGIDVSPLNIAGLCFDADIGTCKFDLAINRINIMPSAQCEPQVAFQTLHYLNWLELAGVRVINGARAHLIGASKALQNGLFSLLGLPHPGAIAIYRQIDALDAAEEIGYPVMIKPNIGGSGSGVARFDSKKELEAAIRIRALDLGVDRTGLVQQYIPSDGFVYRVEVLGDQLFYSIRQPIQQGSFNYCAADGCSTDEGPADQGEFDFCALDAGSRIETFVAEAPVLRNVVEIVRRAGADVGGVEYFINERTGAPCYYDFNPYSNFVSNGEALLGFTPEDRYTEFVADIAASLIDGSELRSA